MKQPQEAKLKSDRGRDVTVTRYSIAHSNVQQLWIRYHTGTSPSFNCHLPDVPRCWGRAHEVIEYFLKDCNNHGKKIPERK